MKLDKLRDNLDLNKKFPNYITKPVFRLILILLVVMAGVDFYLNDFSLTSDIISCDDINGCVNPLYVCQTDYEYFNSDCVKRVQGVQPYCPNNLCYEKTLNNGFYYGRSDFLAIHGSGLIFLIVMLGFIVNHTIYLRRNKKK